MNAADFEIGSRRKAAFSLVEVVLALGICAVTVLGVLGFYGPALQAITAAREAHAAAQVVSAVQAELQRQPFAAVAASVAAGELYYASSAGDHVGSYSSPVWDSLGASQRERDRGKFFAVALRRNPSMPAVPGALVFTLRLSWPAYTPDGRRVPDEMPRGTLLVPAAVSR